MSYLRVVEELLGDYFNEFHYNPVGEVWGELLFEKIIPDNEVNDYLALMKGLGFELTNKKTLGLFKKKIKPLTMDELMTDDDFEFKSRKHSNLRFELYTHYHSSVADVLLIIEDYRNH